MNIQSDYSYNSLNIFSHRRDDRLIRCEYITPVLPYLQSKMLSLNEIIFDQPWIIDCYSYIFEGCHKKK